MKDFYARYSKGQIKIQEMAFVLVAIMIFFVLVILFYVTIRLNGLKDDYSIESDKEAKELVRKLSGTPELAWEAGGCQYCIDGDKAMALKGRRSYENFWKVDYLRIEKVFPNQTGECTNGNYPACRDIVILNKTIAGIPSSAFVNICRYEKSGEDSYIKCELGRVYASFKK